MKMIYIVKYKKNEEENSIFFDSINEAETFCKGLLLKGIKSIIEMEEWHEPSNVEERRKIRVENIFKIYKENLDMPNEVFQKSIEMCNNAFDKKLHLKYSIENVIASSIYISYRIFGIPKTLREISNVRQTNRKTIFKCSEILIREFKLKIPIISKNKYIDEIASKFDFNIEEIEKANEMLEKIKDAEYFKSKDPVVLISSILYIISNEKYTIKEFVERIGISDLALINTIKDIKNYLKLGLEDFEKEKIKEKEEKEIREKEKEKWSKEIIEKEMGLKEGTPNFFIILIILLIVFFILFLINFLKIIK
jgi:transcription initiation factor TFIIIB Brf1 subunit/transcription initiation factor TFIIB